MDNLTREIELAKKSVAYFERKVRQLEGKLVAKQEQGPRWYSARKKSYVFISQMNNRYLLNAARICITGKPADRFNNATYEFNSERQESFYYITREIARRRLHKAFRQLLKTGVMPKGVY